MKHEESPNGAVIFCYTCHKLTPIRPLTCVVLYVARTFLPQLDVGSDRAELRCKDTKNAENSHLTPSAFQLFDYLCLK